MVRIKNKLIFLLVILMSYAFVFSLGHSKLLMANQSGASPIETDVPNIQFEQRFYDFGVAGPQEEIPYEYRFKNTGTGILKIGKIRASCGCIATAPCTKTVPPRGTGVLKVLFKTGKYKGRQTKTIFVDSNDPDEPSIELKISGVVKTEFTLEPECLYFRNVVKGEEVKKSFRFIQFGEDRLVLKRVEANKDFFSTSFQGLKDERHKGFLIDIHLAPEARVGRFSEVITLHSNLKRHPRIDVPIWGDVLGKIRVHPGSLSLGSIKKGAYAAKKIELTAIGEHDFKVVKTESSVPFISMDVSKSENGGGFEITLKVDKMAPAGRLQGELAIYTDDPDQRMIRVPVYGIVKK